MQCSQIYNIYKCCLRTAYVIRHRFFNCRNLIFRLTDTLLHDISSITYPCNACRLSQVSYSRFVHKLGSVQSPDKVKVFPAGNLRALDQLWKFANEYLDVFWIGQPIIASMVQDGWHVDIRHVIHRRFSLMKDFAPC